MTRAQQALMRAQLEAWDERFDQKFDQLRRKVSLREAAKMIQVSPQTITNAIRKDELPCQQGPNRSKQIRIFDLYCWDRDRKAA